MNYRKMNSLRRRGAVEQLNDIEVDGTLLVGETSICQLCYDTELWRERVVSAVPTLQVFITNVCNIRCRGCFYRHMLNSDHMPLSEYVRLLDAGIGRFEKVILLGGEPTLHPDLGVMLRETVDRGFRVTIYSNGTNLRYLPKDPVLGVDLRIGVLSLFISEKPLLRVQTTSWPTTVVYMLRKDNVCELVKAAEYAASRLSCKSFYLSSIRDIGMTGSFWLDTVDTLSPYEYARVAQRFLDECPQDLQRIDFATRGVLFGSSATLSKARDVTRCRFWNEFPGGRAIQCPFDIALEKYATERVERSCNKHTHCILQKISLERIT